MFTFKTVNWQRPEFNKAMKMLNDEQDSYNSDYQFQFVGISFWNGFYIGYFKTARKVKK